MKNFVKKIAACTAIMCIALAAKEVTVEPSKAIIVITPQCGGVGEFAAYDLQKHFKLITGQDIPVADKVMDDKYVFLFDKAPEGLLPEEARWEVTEQMTTFSGDDSPLKRGTSQAYFQNRTGTISAVSDFLERQLGVRWMEPGDDGIFYVPAHKLILQTGKGSWNPGRLVTRSIRQDYARWAYDGAKLNAKGLPEEFILSKEEYTIKTQENKLWQKHQRMGYSMNFWFGHAFTNWWEKYGKEHPEYFALFKGKREPQRPKRPDTIKMCVSNQAFRQQIIDNWKARKPLSKFINVCENDWGDYCECDDCRKLDVTPEGEPWENHLSDRYFNLANGVLALARKEAPDTKVCIYAYSTYVEPPRRERVDSGIVIGFVPSMLKIKSTEDMYKGWRARGADWMVLRPNDHHVNTGLPMGFEKQILEGFQLGVQNGIVGTDYDSCHGFWTATGVADYILARAHSYPNATFEELFNHFCQGYGAAASHIREYYTYWRENVWEQRLIPNKDKIIERGRYGNFRRGIIWDLKKYYTAEDFEKTGAILERALANAKTPVELKRIKSLMLGHKHEAMTFNAIIATGKDKRKAGRELLEFRIANRDKLNVNLMRLSSIELDFGDVTGIAKAKRFMGCEDVQELPLRWKFAMDPNDEGEKNHWEKLPWADVSKTWTQIRTDSSWEQQYNNDMPQELKDKLKNYDGYGWYALSVNVPQSWRGRKVSLLFGAVDETAKIYVNGTLCGIREFINSDDWKTPFTIPIFDAIDWNKPQQSIFVRVHDKAGAGGIWQPVALITPKE